MTEPSPPGVPTPQESDSGAKPRPLALAGTLLSLLACYGTLGLVAALGAAGISLNVNEHVWAAAIVLFAFAAVIGVVLGARRRHGNWAPAAVAALGAALVAASMYAAAAIEGSLGLSARVVEVVGFAVLIAAALWDYRACKAV